VVPASDRETARPYPKEPLLAQGRPRRAAAVPRQPAARPGLALLCAQAFASPGFNRTDEARTDPVASTRGREEGRGQADRHDWRTPPPLRLPRVAARGDSRCLVFRGRQLPVVRQLSTLPCATTYGDHLHGPVAHRPAGQTKRRPQARGSGLGFDTAEANRANKTESPRASASRAWPTLGVIGNRSKDYSTPRSRLTARWSPDPWPGSESRCCRPCRLPRRRPGCPRR